jgi:hypothetical protein
MITNVQRLREQLEELRERITRLEDFVSLPPLPVSEPESEPPKPPKGGLRHWSSGAGQFDSATSRRWRNR